MRKRPSLAAMAVALLVSLPSAQARADDPATAQALFTDAKKLMAAGKYSDACPKLEESDHASPAIGTKFNLADCYEHTGRTASAWAGFLSVASAARNANQAAREKAARDRAKALEPKLSRISIVVQTPVDGIEVKRDDESIGSAQWGEALPVDPGEHTLTAKATGKRPWKTIVDVATGPSTVKVIIPALDDEPNPPPAAAATAPAGSTSSPASPPPAGESGGSSASTVGWVLLGVGAAAAIGGGVFWVLRSNDASQLQADCGPSGNNCNKPGDAADISNGKTYDVLAITLFAVGGAAMLGGAGLLIAGAGHHATATASLVPVAEPGGGGLLLRGTF